MSYVGTPDVRYPAKSVAVNVSSADQDLTLSFPVGYATELYVGGAGTVVAQLLGDSSSETYTGVPAGTTLYGIFTKVFHSGTTASGIIARGR